MAVGKKNYELPTEQVVIDEDAFIAIDKSGYSEAQKIKQGKYLQSFLHKKS